MVEPALAQKFRAVRDWRAHPPPWASRTYLSVSLLLAAVYFASGKLGLAFAVVHPNATLVWPPTGISLAALLLLGYRLWPAVFAGALLVNLTTAGTGAASVGIAIGNAGEALVGAYLVNRFANGPLAFRRSASVLSFTLFVLLANAVSATIGASTLVGAGLAPWSALGSIWLTWWLGDAVGALILAPLLVLWFVADRQRWDRRKILEGAAVGAGLFLASWFVFRDPVSPLKFLCIPFILWAVVRFGQLEAAAAVLFLASFAIWSVVRTDEPPSLSLLTAQGFAGVIAAMALTVSAAVDERRRAEEALRQARDELAGRVEVTGERLAGAEHQARVREARLLESEERLHLLVTRVKEYAILTLDVDGHVASWNEGAERIKGYHADEILGRHLSVFHTPEEVTSNHPEELLKRAELEGHVEEEGWRVRKDGSRFWAFVSITALRDDVGRLRGFAKVTRDLTERRHTELALTDLAGRILTVQDEEKRRIARELHDSTSPLLTALTGKLYTIKRHMNATNDTTAKALDDSLTLAEHASSVIRNTSSLLHPALLDQSGLLVTLRWYLEGFARRTGIRLDTGFPDRLTRLPEGAELALFRIVEECLSNILRHSGSKTGTVSITESPGLVTLEVRDGGRGFGPGVLIDSAGTVTGPGLGIRGMAERTKQLGGRLEIESTTSGASIKAILPRTRAG